MLVKELLRNIDDIVPFSWAEEWDNSGFLVGDPEAPVTGIAVSLDPGLDSLSFAAEKKCSVLISHHPLIFSPLRAIDISAGVGKAIAFALKNGIAIISMHTNWDSSPKGVNAALASGIGLRSVSPLVPSDSGAWGSGALGDLPSPSGILALGEKIRSGVKLSRLDVYGDPARMVKRLALCGGSGGSLWKAAKVSGADAFFTSDMKYHERLDALEGGISLLIADHGEAESFSLDALADVIAVASGTGTCIFRGARGTPVVMD